MVLVVKCSFAKGDGNKVLHALAHSQPVEGGQELWDSGFPSTIVHFSSSR